MSDSSSHVDRPSREELLLALRENRRVLAHEIDDLGHAVNVKERFENAFKKNAPLWIGGGFAAGLVISMLSVPRQKVDREGNVKARSPLVGLLTTGLIQGFRLARPALSALALREAKKFLDPRMAVAKGDDGATAQDDL